MRVMEGLNDKKIELKDQQSVEALHVPFDLDTKFGVKKFCESLSPLLVQSSKQDLTDAEIKFISGSCSKLSEEIRRELKLKSPSASEVPLLLSLKDLCESINEHILNKSEFSRRIKDYDAGRLGNCSETERHFLGMAVTQCDQGISADIERLSLISVGEVPIGDRLKRMAQVLLASAALLSVGGKAKEDEFAEPKAAPTAAATASGDEIPQLEGSSFSQSLNDPAIQSQQYRADPTLNPSINNGIDSSRNYSKNEISFPLSSSIKDTLWVGDVYTRDARGRYNKVERNSQILSQEVEATFTEEFYEAYPQKKIELLAPIGYAPTSISLTTHDGTPVDFNFHQGTQSLTITGMQKRGPVVLKYNVIEAREDIDLSNPAHVPIARSAQINAMIDALKKDPSRVEDVLSALFSKYTYLTSQDIGGIVERMSGRSREELYTNIRYADCDTASVVAAGLLNEAGIKAGVICGRLERDGSAKLAHAKIIYEDYQGELKTYECTQEMRRAFKNVDLLLEDKISLISIAQKCSSQDDISERLSLYKEFNEELDRIFAKEEYRSDERDPEELSSSERSLLDNMLAAHEQIELNKKVFLDFGLMSFALGAIGAGSFLLGRVASRKYRESVSRELSSSVENPLQVKTNSPRTIKGIAEQIGADVDRALESMSQSWKGNPEMKHIFDDVRSLDLEKKQVVLKYLSIVSSVSLDGAQRMPLSTPQYLLYSGRVREQIRNNSSEVMSINEAYKIALKETFNHKNIEKFRQLIPETARQIIKEAQEYPPGTRSSVRIEDGNIQLEKSSNRKSQDRSDEFYGYREYSAGESAQNIDWVASARSSNDRLLVREYRAPKTIREDKREPIHIILDLSQGYRLNNFVRELLNADKDSANRIESITICGNGEILQTIEPKLTKRVLGMSNLENLESLVCKLLELQLEVNPEYLGEDTVTHFIAHDRLKWAGICGFPTSLLSPDRKIKIIDRY